VLPALAPADVEFMQGMIVHHSQAVEMTALIESHTENKALRTLGAKISSSQSDEIRFMKRWLIARGQATTMAEGAMAGMGSMPGMDAMDMAPMPGMLTPEQMKALDEARGSKFDELFLTGMIQHHKGALTMVAELRAAGGGKETNIGDFMNNVDNDQRMEIVRMYGLLGRPVEKL